MDLETAFYIVGIVFMTVMMVLIGVLVAAVLVIKAKVDKVHDTIETKVNQAKALTTKFAVVLNTIRFFLRMKKSKRTPMG